MGTLTLPETMTGASAAYAMLGRALTLAASFESDCRILAFSLKLKEPSLDTANPQDIERFLGEVVFGKLVKNQDLVVSGFRLSLKYKEWLSAAREARNYIAHEAGEDFEKKFAAQTEWADWCQALRTKLHEIAIGKVVLAILLSRSSTAEIPDRESIASYPDRITEWVFREQKEQHA